MHPRLHMLPILLIALTQDAEAVEYHWGVSPAMGGTIVAHVQNIDGSWIRMSCEMGGDEMIPSLSYETKRGAIRQNEAIQVVVGPENFQFSFDLAGEAELSTGSSKMELQRLAKALASSKTSHFTVEAPRIGLAERFSLKDARRALGPGRSETIMSGCNGSRPQPSTATVRASPKPSMPSAPRLTAPPTALSSTPATNALHWAESTGALSGMASACNIKLSSEWLRNVAKRREILSSNDRERIIATEMFEGSASSAFVRQSDGSLGSCSTAQAFVQQSEMAWGSAVSFACPEALNTAANIGGTVQKSAGKGMVALDRTGVGEITFGCPPGEFLAVFAQRGQSLADFVKSVALIGVAYGRMPIDTVHVAATRCLSEARESQFDSARLALGHLTLDCASGKLRDGLPKLTFEAE